MDNIYSSVINPSYAYYLDFKEFTSLKRNLVIVLNDFITKVKNHGGEAAFKYLLAKSFAFEFKPKKPLSKAKKSVLDSEFNKINEYFVDKV